MLRHICVRDVNLAVTYNYIQNPWCCVNTGNSHSTENFIAMVGSGSDFHPLFYSESDKNSHFEGSKQEEIDTLRSRDHFDFDCGSEFDFAGWMES